MEMWRRKRNNLDENKLSDLNFLYETFQTTVFSYFGQFLPIKNWT